ncbi:MAG: hypothetical protein WC796_00375 [Candidatus Pacearchaeota archaeon]|jgi:hypothetical protein
MNNKDLNKQIVERSLCCSICGFSDKSLVHAEKEIVEQSLMCSICGFDDNSSFHK